MKTLQKNSFFWYFIVRINEVDEAKLFHTANVSAQYLDNDEDGIPDNIKVLDALKTNHRFLLVWKNEYDLNIYSSLENANAMDVERGGQFTNTPKIYSENAWYTYEDCDYDCQISEYTYWALTSILGAQGNRLGGIGHEWRLNTSVKVQQTDATVYSLLTDSQYSFPTVLPDGKCQQ